MFFTNNGQWKLFFSTNYAASAKQFRVYPLAITSPNWSFQSDADSGLWSDSSGADNGPDSTDRVHLVSGGVSKANVDPTGFNADQINAGRIHSGPGVFYVQSAPSNGTGEAALTVEGAFSQIAMDASSGTTRTSTPQYSFAGQQTDGYGYNDTANYLQVIMNGGRKMFWSATYNESTQRLNLQSSGGTEAVPALVFSGDTNTGMWRPAADTLAWSVGGAEGMRLDSDKQLHVASTVEAPLILGDQGTFYTSVGIGDYAGEDNMMWRLGTESGSDELTIEPTIKGATAGHLNVDAPMKMWDTQTDVTNGSPFMDYSPALLVSAYIPSAVLMKLSPTVHVNGTGPIMNGLSAEPTFNITASNITLFNLFNGEPVFECNNSGAGQSLPLAFIYSAAPVINVNDGPLNDQGIAMNIYNSTLTLRGTSSTADFTYNEITAYRSSLILNTTHADAVANVLSFTDFEAATPAVSGIGTELLTTHNALLIEGDSISTNVNGIRSYLPNRSGARFINHTGGAESRHTGDFYVQGDIQTDRVIIPNNQKYTPTNVSVDRAYDADSTTTAELADVLGTLIDDLKNIGLIG